MKEKHYSENNEKTYEGCCDHEVEENCCCDEEPQMVNVVFEDESELPCEIIGTYEVDDKEYMILLPENKDEVFIYRYEPENGEGKELVLIEDDEEYKKAAEAYYKLIED